MVYDPGIPVRGIHPKEMKSGCQAAKRFLHLCIYYSQQLRYEINQGAHQYIILDKENVMHIYTNAIQSQKEWNLLICSNVDELTGHYIKENKPGTKDKYLMILCICGN